MRVDLRRQVRPQGSSTQNATNCHRRFMALIRCALILPLLIYGVVTVALPRRAAAAGTRITLSRGSAAPGTAVTVRGSGFTAGDTVTIELLTPGAGPGSLRRLLTMNTPTGRGGGFSAPLHVPAGAPAANDVVLAQDTHGNGAYQLLHVPLELQLKSGTAGPRAAVVPGEEMTITGSGFTGGEQVALAATFTVGGNKSRKVTKTVTADSSGAIGPVTLTVPWAARDGTGSLTATGRQSGKNGAVTATLNVRHTPFLFLLSSPATAGHSISAISGGFIPGEQVSASFPIARKGAAGTTLTGSARAGGFGVATLTLFLPGDTRAGTDMLTVSGSVSQAQVSVRVRVAASSGKPGPAPGPKPTATPPPSKAAITVAPISIIPGGNAQVRGTGFVPRTQVTVSVTVQRTNGSSQTLTLSPTSNRHGTFLTTLHTPADAAAGTYQVTAKGTGGKTATGKLVVAALKPSIVVVPPEALPGTAITVQGFGFSAGTNVTISLAGQTLGTVTTSSSGAFKTSVTVPGSQATGQYTVTAQASSGQRASIGLRVYRKITTHFYFASLYTGGFHEYLQLVNTSATRASVKITYQRASGAPRTFTTSVPAHARVTHDVNRDLGPGVNAAAVVATDVPISAERMVLHGREGSIDPGTTSPSKIWYFANGNTSHQYQEYIAVQNPTNSSAAVTLQVQPTHSRTYYLHRTMPPQSRTTWNLNQSSHDAIGVIVTASVPVVANRTIFIHHGLTSKTGVTGPQTHWYFAAGPTRSGTRYWIGVINSTNKWSYMTLHAYNAQGTELTTIKHWLRPYDREGYLMNKYAGQTDVAVAVTTTQPSIAEQSTFVTGIHDAHTDSFGVTTPQKTAQFAAATTWAHQDNLLALFNPNLVPVPIVVQFLNAHGATTQQTYVVPPLAHQFVDVGKVVPNAQLGLLAASNSAFVALDRQTINDGAGAMTSLGTQS